MKKKGEKGELTVNVFGLVPIDLANSKFTVGCLGSTVTSWKVVDDNTENFLAARPVEVSLEGRNGLDGVTGGPSVIKTYNSKG